MDYYKSNLAYDLRLFEDEEIYSSAVKTEEKQKQKQKPKTEKQNTAVESSRTPIKKIRRRKNNFLKISGAVALAVAIAIVVGLIIHGQPTLRGGAPDLCGDHRIAMAAALCSLRCSEPVALRGTECTDKSHPNFFADFLSLRKEP